MASRSCNPCTGIWFCFPVTLQFCLCRLRVCTYILWSAEAFPKCRTATCSPSPATHVIIAVQTQKHFSQGRIEILQLITPLESHFFTKKYGGNEIVVDGFKKMQLLGRDMGLELCGFAPDVSVSVVKHPMVTIPKSLSGQAATLPQLRKKDCCPQRQGRQSTTVF